MEPRYVGLGWWVSVVDGVEKWDTVAAYEQPFEQPLPTDPDERRKRLEVLGFFKAIQ
jgi:hypothetical protein